MKREDAELIEQYLRGDSEAAGTVETWVLRAARPFRHRLEPAFSDVLQEALLEVTRLLRAGQFRGEAGLPTYLWRVTCSVCLQEIRARTRWQWSDLGDDIPEPEGADPLEAFVRQEVLGMVATVIRRAPNQCRDLWNRVLEGQSYDLIARQLGVTEGALRVRLLRCRRRAAMLRAQWYATGRPFASGAGRDPDFVIVEENPGAQAYHGTSAETSGQFAS